MASSAPFTEDALNRFRITHSDRELRPLLRRIHRLGRVSGNTGADDDEEGKGVGKDGGNVDREIEKEIIKLELIKWKIGIERMMASVQNLERMKGSYERRTDETVERTQLLRGTLEDEQQELRDKKMQRDHNVACDQVAEKIQLRGKSRKELDQQIATLESSLEEQRTSHAEYIQIVQNRLDLFGQITKLIEDCKSTKLPVDSTITSTPPSSSIDEVQIPHEKDKMDLDLDTLPSSGSGTGNAGKLNASAVPFQPTTTSTTTSSPSSSSLKVPGNHNLPSRPSSSRSSNSNAPAPSPLRSASTATSTSTSLPARPSALRSSTTPLVNYASGSGSLEDGEVGEEGEVGERGNKRGRERQGDNSNSNSGSRNTRSRIG